MLSFFLSLYMFLMVMNYNHNPILMLVGMQFLMILLIWVSSTYVSMDVLNGYKLFYFTELLIFLSLLMTYYYFVFSPSIESKVFSIPSIKNLSLFNTVLLFNTSLIMHFDKNLSLLYLVMFLGMQGFEYYLSDLDLTDAIYGNLFYILTGFHGLHVLMAIIMLILHHFNKDPSKTPIMDFYMHMVDGLWFYMYMWVY